MLVATAPLFARPQDREAAAYALTSLGRVRYLSVASLLALAGPHGLRDAPELIGDWVNAGLVHRGQVRTDVIGGQNLDYLALTTKGGRAVEAATGRFVGGLPAAQLRRQAQKTRHNLWVGETIASFMALADEGRIALAGVEADDKRLGTSVVVTKPGLAPERVPLQPDGLVVTESRVGPNALLIEVDMGTTSLVPRMLRKYEGYLEWQRQRGPERDFNMKALRVLTLAPTAQRLAKLHDAALRANGGRRSGFLLFGLLEDMAVSVAERLLGPVARQLGGEVNHRIPVLSELPHVNNRAA